MLQYHRIYRLFPKTRFYLIAAAIVAALWWDQSRLKGEMGTLSALVIAVLIMMGYMIVINGSSALALALIPGEGKKYFRSLPNAYGVFRRALLLNEILGILLTAAICLSVWFAGLGERKVFYLLIAGEIILSAAHFSMRAKTRTRHTLILGGSGGVIGGLVSAVSVGEELPLFVTQIAAMIFGAVWVFSTVFFYKDLRKLWNRN